MSSQDGVVCAEAQAAMAVREKKVAEKKEAVIF
jgi:hypothetical protein